MFSDVVTRLLAVVQSLAQAHLQLAQQEASRDLSRMITGAVLLACAALFAVTGWLTANALASMFLAAWTTLALIESVAVVFGVNVLLALVFGTLGVRKVRRPVLKETRGLLKKTAHSLTH